MGGTTLTVDLTARPVHLASRTGEGLALMTRALAQLVRLLTGAVVATRGPEEATSPETRETILQATAAAAVFPRTHFQMKKNIPALVTQTQTMAQSTKSTSVAYAP